MDDDSQEGLYQLGTHEAVHLVPDLTLINSIPPETQPTSSYHYATDDCPHTLQTD